MYHEPLTKTSIEVLAFLSSKIRDSFTMRQIAEATGKDYKITHTMTTRLIKQGLINAQMGRPATLCRLNLKGNTQTLSYIEWIRTSRFFEKHRDTEIPIKDIISKMPTPYYTLIIFGSQAKNEPTPRSDLDILLITPDHTLRDKAESTIGAVQRVTPVTIHDTILTHNEFKELLNEKKPNIAWEAVDNRITAYGAEPLLKTLEDTL